MKGANSAGLRLRSVCDNHPIHLPSVFVRNPNVGAGCNRSDLDTALREKLIPFRGLSGLTRRYSLTVSPPAQYQPSGIMAS